MAGCLAEPADEARDASRDIGAEQESADSLTLSGDNRVAHATRVNTAHVHVAIHDQVGARQFSVDYRLGGDDDETIRWTVFTAAGGSQEVEAASGGLKQELRELPSLSDAIGAALYMQGRASVSPDEQAYDSHGCDIPTWAVNSCGSKGKCCDVHDSCYAKNGCTASSWYWTLPGGACDRCNGAVVNCILTQNPGPSYCCAAGNCGRPR
ncbi:uncharacterized protein CMC5_049570 [Chondromyces crocatus]|uniref:Uncharacterized protein n=1 Tax=Chondromyces crocatus TaxID=52 RepID=A0A0K1EIV4_CHOCO|nr:uncharacterized protein CMC5_049570 [Chondromyces crocatus]